MTTRLQGPPTAQRQSVKGAESKVPSRRWSPHGGRLLGVALAAPAILVVILLVVAPLGQVFVDAASGGAGMDRYRDVFTDDVSRRALLTTLTDSLIVTATTVAVGAVLAWTLHVTDRGWLRLCIWLTALIPFSMGVIVKNYSVLLLLVANGPVNEVLLWTGLRDTPVSMLYTKFAVIYGISYSLLPYAVLTLYSVFSGVDRNLLSSAAILGASRHRILTSVVLPLTRGGFLVASALIFVLSIGFYITPILLGGLQTPFVATVISQQIFILYDYPAAAATAAVTLVVALMVMGLALAFAGGRTFKKVLQ